MSNDAPNPNAAGAMQPATLPENALAMAREIANGDHYTEEQRSFLADSIAESMGFDRVQFRMACGLVTDLRHPRVLLLAALATLQQPACLNAEAVVAADIRRATSLISEAIRKMEAR